MNRCIYTGKTDRNATFTQKEHIIPKAIGGIFTLPTGYVSDEVNHRFSIWEEQFVHQFPPVALSRRFFGPDGRKKHLQVDGISFMTTIKDEKIQLGYLYRGKPYSLDQAIITLDKGLKPQKQIEFIFNPEKIDTGAANMDYRLHYLHKFLIELKAADSKYRLIYDDGDELLNKIYIGVRKNKIFIGLSKKQNYGDVHALINQLLKFLEDIKISNNFKKNFDEQPTFFVSQVQAKLQIEFNRGFIEKVYAKIAFNVLAQLTSQEFVLRPCFDPLRESILSDKNEDISEFQFARELNCDCKINKYWQLLGIGNYMHMVTFNRVEGNLVAMIQLYGSCCIPIFITMCKDNGNISDFNTNYLQGYLCDWEHKEEKPLIQLVVDRMHRSGNI